MFHYAQHISTSASAGNPRMHWCYPDEDYMRILKKVAERCLAGSRPALVAANIVTKMLLGMIASLKIDDAL